MRQGTYLNVILSINAVLLTALIWTQLAGPAGPSPDAAAAQLGTSGTMGGIPNAGEQRLLMLRSLARVEKSLDGISKHLENGKLTVSVDNLHEIQLAMPLP